MMKCITKKATLSLAALLIAGLSLAGESAYATSITYQFTLTPKTGTVGGTVLVTFDNAIPVSGSFDANTTDSDSATTTKITSLVATLTNGNVFTLANSGNQADIGFFNGAANNFSYYANSGIPLLQLQGVGSSNNTGYVYSSNGNFSGNGYSAGTLVFNGVAMSGAPEPSSLVLLGSGILGVAGAARRRFAV